jgi:hypothetical protein
MKDVSPRVGEIKVVAAVIAEAALSLKRTFILVFSII